MTDVQIGSAKYGGGGQQKREYLKIQDGDNFFRILPPIGSLAAEGKWAVYASVHFGVRRADNKMVTFHCVEKKDRKTKMVTQRCAMCDLIAERKHAAEVREKKMRDEGQDPEIILLKLKPELDWLRTYNLSRKWYVNAIDTSGKIGQLQFAHAYYKQLELHINDLALPKVKGRKPIDPISPDGGVVFNFFYKKGNQKTRMQTVSIKKNVKTTAEGEEVEVTAMFPLSDAIINRYKTEYSDLGKIARTFTPAQIKAIVDSGFDPSLVESIYSTPKVEAATVSTMADAVAEQEEEIPEETEAKMPVQAQAQTAPAQETKAQVSTPAPKQIVRAADKFDSLFDDL